MALQCASVRASDRRVAQSCQITVAFGPPLLASGGVNEAGAVNAPIVPLVELRECSTHVSGGAIAQDIAREEEGMRPAHPLHVVKDRRLGGARELCRFRVHHVREHECLAVPPRRWPARIHARRRETGNRHVAQLRWSSWQAFHVCDDHPTEHPLQLRIFG